MDHWEQDWLTRRIELGEPLTRVLGEKGWGGNAQRIVVLEALAAELRLKADTLRDAAYHVLDSMLEPLQNAMAEGAGHWTDETDRHTAIAKVAVEATEVDMVLAAFHQFRWQRERLPRDIEVVDIEVALRAILTRKLGERLFKALDRWRTAGVWNETMQRRGRRPPA